MYLWRRLATPRWWVDNEEKLRARCGDQLVVIEQPHRKRLQIEVVCNSPDLVEKFGGRVKKLSRDWLKCFLREQKTKPIKVGKRLVIDCNVRGTSVSRRSRPRGPSHISIPAGMAFGTGEHATTAMSLRLLARVTRNWERGWSHVDLGTGSGILALAGKCLGATHVAGIDSDPIAISTAKQNARLNKIDKVKFQLADVRRWKFPRKIDIVTANLFSELLIEILPKLKRSRWLILSGVLRDQERGLVRALKRHKFDIFEVRRRGKWVAIGATVG